MNKNNFTLENSLIVSLVYIPKDTKRIFAYPPLPQNSPYLFDLLPSYAFPDIISNPTYFIIPSTQPMMRLYGISMIYPTHALVLLTYSLYFKPLTDIFCGYYSLFEHPNPQQLMTIYNSMKCCSLPSEMFVPHYNIFGSITKLMKLSLLPCKTIVYSQKISNASLSLLYFMAAIPGLLVEVQGEKNEALGFPLLLDTMTHPIIPHLPMSLIDKLIGIEGYIIASSHQVFSELSSDWDVVINLDTNKCKCKKELQSILNDTKEDRLFLITIREYAQKGKYSHCMKLIELYYQGLLNTAAPFAKKMNEISWEEIATSPLNDYGIDFLKEWFVSTSFLNWKESVAIDKALQYNQRHPGKSQVEGTWNQMAETITAYTVSDWMIRSAVKMSNFYLNVSEYMKPKNETNEETKENDGPVFETNEDDDEYVEIPLSNHSDKNDSKTNEDHENDENQIEVKEEKKEVEENNDENEIVDADEIPI